MSIQKILSKIFYEPINSKIRVCIVMFFSLLAFYFRLRWRVANILWLDELWVLRSFRKSSSLWDAIQTFSHQEHVGFLNGTYIIVYPFLKMFGFSRFGLSIPYMVVTVVGFYFFYLICKEFLTTIFGYIIVFLVCAVISIMLITYFCGTRMIPAMHYNTFQFIPDPRIDIIGFLKGIFCNLLGYKKLYIVFLGLIPAFILPHQDRVKQIKFFLILIIFPVAFILIADILWTYWFLQRQFIWVIPFFALLLGWSWESCFKYIYNKRKCVES